MTFVLPFFSWSMTFRHGRLGPGRLGNADWDTGSIMHLHFWALQFNDIGALFFSWSMTFRSGHLGPGCLGNADYALGRQDY